MKTEAEIRRYVADLQAAHAQPCDCLRVGTRHLPACLAGGGLALATIDVLTWVLCENEGYQRLVDGLARR